MGSPALNANKLYRRSSVTVEKTIKVYKKKRNLAVESDEAQLWIDAEFIKISKFTQKAIYSELVSRITSIPTAQKRFSALYPDYNFEWNR